MNLTPEEQELLRQAQEARMRAYAPYSGYAVGSAIRTAEGRIFTGCNVENASYGLSVCAERVALFKAVSEGARTIVAVTVITQEGAPPCGACLQVLSEFVQDPQQCIVWLATPDHLVRRATLAELFPTQFRLNRAE